MLQFLEKNKSQTKFNTFLPHYTNKLETFIYKT